MRSASRECGEGFLCNGKGKGKTRESFDDDTADYLLKTGEDEGRESETSSETRSDCKKTLFQSIKVRAFWSHLWFADRGAQSISTSS